MKYSELLDLIYDMEDCDDVGRVEIEIEDSYKNGKISKSEKDDLLSAYEDEKVRIPLIDGYDWELMKEFDPNLSEQ